MVKSKMRIDRRALRWLFPVLSLAILLVSSASIQAQTPKTNLVLYVTGSYPGEITPGKTNTLFLEARNDGNTPVTDIHFSAIAPEGWQVNFEPLGLDSLSAGSSYSVIVYVIPDQFTDRGYYSITLIAEANETRSITNAGLQIDSGTSFWMWVGIGLGALIIAGFILVYLRFGRQ